MQLGLVTNCLQADLAVGMSLGDLVEVAVSRGLTVVELRQGSLGEFEVDDPPVPNADSLAELSLRFPHVRFNVALAWPYLDATTDRNDPLVHAAIDAAFAVSGEHPAHLRLVDHMTSSDDVADPETVAACLERVSRPLADLGGVLSIENARLPWLQFREMFEVARARVQGNTNVVQLCYDPGNLLVSEQSKEAIERFDPSAVTRSLDASAIALVHAKQRRDGTWLETVAEGDLDWIGQFAALEEIGYTGPLLLETVPSDDVWSAFDASVDYLRSLEFE